MSEAELHWLRQRLHKGKLTKAEHGELRFRLPVGLVYDPTGRVVLDPDEEVQAAMDEGALREMPKITKRTGFLALFANLAMLCGLFGTIVGLIKAFGAVGGESVDPSQKARILAEGISEAMNCTAFGLISAITALMGFAFLNGKTQSMEDDINEASVTVLNLVVANRQKVNLQGIEG